MKTCLLEKGRYPLQEAGAKNPARSSNKLDRPGSRSIIRSSSDENNADDDQRTDIDPDLDQGQPIDLGVPVVDRE